MQYAKVQGAALWHAHRPKDRLARGISLYISAARFGVNGIPGSPEIGV
jgi:hypothetical protein